MGRGQKKGFKHTDLVALEIMRQSKLLLWEVPEYQEKMRCVRGNKGAMANKKNQTGMFAPDFQKYGLHVRWHVNRGKVNAKCVLCCDDTRKAARSHESSQ